MPEFLFEAPAPHLVYGILRPGVVSGYEPLTQNCDILPIAVDALVADVVAYSRHTADNAAFDPEPALFGNPRAIHEVFQGQDAEEVHAGHP